MKTEPANDEHGTLQRTNQIATEDMLQRVKSRLQRFRQKHATYLPIDNPLPRPEASAPRSTDTTGPHD